MISSEFIQNYRSHLSECKVQNMGEGVVGHDPLPSHIVHLCADNLACFEAASAHGTHMQHISRSHLRTSNLWLQGPQWHSPLSFAGAADSPTLVSWTLKEQDGPVRSPVSATWPPCSA